MRNKTVNPRTDSMNEFHNPEPRKIERKRTPEKYERQKEKDREKKMIRGLGIKIPPGKQEIKRNKAEN